MTRLGAAVGSETGSETVGCAGLFGTKGGRFGEATGEKAWDLPSSKTQPSCRNLDSRSLSDLGKLFRPHVGSVLSDSGSLLFV